MTHDPYFYVSDAAEGSVVEVTGEDAKHLAKVRRAAPGQRITLSDGAGGVFEAQIVSVEPTRVEARVLGSLRIPVPSPRIVVYQALAKHDKLDLVVTKLTELNTAAVHVFRAERSVPRWSEDKAARAEARWRNLALEAAKQSRRAHLPEVSGVLDFDEMAGRASARGHVVAAHAPSSIRLREALPHDAEELAIVIGPEGGFTDMEVAKLEQLGATAVSLGPTVLRTETAGVAAVCMAMYGYGLMG